jgi:hypothetical protein
MANLSPGDKAVPFELPGVDGRPHALEDYADKEAVEWSSPVTTVPTLEPGRTA